MNKRYFFYYFISLFAFGCSNQYSGIEDLLNDEFRINLKNKKLILIIPYDGCGRCIERSLELSYKFIEDDTYVFIISGATKKQINQFYKNTKYLNKIILDKYEILKSKKLVFTEPTLIPIEDGLIKEIIKTNDTSIINSYFTE